MCYLEVGPQQRLGGRVVTHNIFDPIFVAVVNRPTFWLPGLSEDKAQERLQKAGDSRTLSAAASQPICGGWQPGWSQSADPRAEIRTFHALPLAAYKCFVLQA